LLLELSDTLAGLPWELLYDPEQSGERGFLAHRCPLMRLSSSAAPLAPIEPPLRVLLLISSPPSLGEDSRVDVESERAAVEHAVHEMRQAGLLHLLVEDIVTLKRVQQLLMRFRPHIVHYVGHGGYSDTSGGVLLWEDEQGNELELSAQRVASLLRPRNLHAVVLHACQTGRSNAQTDVPDVAGTLVKEGIAAVLAQQANFTYESSQRASEAWYTALTAGQGFADALFEVRQALIQADRPDWAVPILYGSTASLTPLLDIAALPGPADPLLKSSGAAADLPTPTGVFVGRHRELRALRLMLESVHGSGPVMALITGPGGVGKSTLVAQAVTRYGRMYKAVLTLRCQGYQSVELFLKEIGEFLAGLGTPGFLEQCLPNPKLSTQAKIGEAIVALNAAGPLLMVIDNLESVQNKDQTISDPTLLHLLQKLLTNLRSGRVLVTGRYAVKDLLPQGKFAANLRHLHLDDLSSYETNQLLLRHPALAKLGETVREKLINEFGGLPYVYDLLSSDAASQSLDLLIHDVQMPITEAQKQRTEQEWEAVRQQVIEFAALEATVQRLSPASHGLLTQLSVLRRPFPLAMISEGLGAARAAWQPLLDWSLLHYDPQERSYHLHNLTMRYAEGLLEEEPRKQVQAQLAGWYEHYADQASHDLADYLEAHRLLRAADHVQQAGQLVMRLADTLRRFGLYPLLHDLCTKTLSDIRQSDQLLAASALDELGKIAYLQGEYEEARGLYRQSLEIKERLGDQSGRARTLHQLGMMAQDQGEYEEARGLYRQSLEIKERLGDQSGRAGTLHQLGMMAQDQGEYEEARGLYRQSLEIKERLGDQSGRVRTLLQLGMIAQNQGKYEEARDLYHYSLDIFERLGDQSGRARTLLQLGMIAQDQGEYKGARGLYQQSLDIFERLGDQSRRARTLLQLGMIAQNQGKYEEARDLYHYSLGICERLGDQSGRARTQLQLGMVAYLQGEYEEARGLYQQSLDIFERLGDQSGRAHSLLQLGVIAQDQGEYEEAHGLYQQSLDIFERLGDSRGRAHTLHELGNLVYLQGKHEEAHGLYQQSLEISERLGDEQERAATLYQLGVIAQGQGNYEEARRFYQESLGIRERLGDRSGRATTLHQLGVIAQAQSSYGEARRLYVESLDLFERLRDQEGRTRILYQLGMIAQTQGNYEEARGLYSESLDLFEQLGDHGGRANILCQLGMVAQAQGNYEEARSLYVESLDIKERLGDLVDRANTLAQLGTLAQAQGDYVQAQRLYEESLAISERLGDLGDRARVLHQLGNLTQVQGDYAQARRLYEESLAISEQLGDLAGRANTLMQLGTLVQVQDDYVQAQQLYEESLAVFERLGDLPSRANTLVQLGTLAQVQGDYAQARRLYEESLAISERLGTLPGRARALYQLGNLMQVQGDYAQARRLYEESLAISERLGDLVGRANTLVQLGTLAQVQGDYAQARRLYEECLSIFERLGDLAGRTNTLVQLGNIASILSKLGEVLVAAGQWDKALEVYERALNVQQRLGDQAGLAGTRSNIRAIYSHLESSQIPLSFVIAEAKRFFQYTGFTLGTTDEPNSFLCYPAAPIWEKKIKSGVYTQIVIGKVLDEYTVLHIRDATQKLEGEMKIAFVIVDQTVDERTWMLISALRAGKFNLIPIPLTFILEKAIDIQSKADLDKHLERFLGRGFDPYDIHMPVFDVLNFFGREALAHNLVNDLASGQPIGLFGLRRIGKSSLMRFIQGLMPCPTAFLNLQSEMKPADLYTRILRDWQADAQSRGIDLGLRNVAISSVEPSAEFFRIAQSALDNLAQQNSDGRLAFFFDEIDSIKPSLDAVGPDLERYLAFLQTLRSLVQEDRRFSLMVAGSDPVINRSSRWGNEQRQNPFYLLLQEFFVPPLLEADCVQMFRNIGSQIELSYSDEAANAIARASGGHPFLARQLCSLVYTLRRNRPGEVKLPAIQKATERFLIDNKYASAINDMGLWGTVTNLKSWGEKGAQANQTVLFTLAGSLEPVAESTIIDAPESDALHSALFELQHLHVIRAVEEILGSTEPYYAITFGLLQSWIRRTRLGLEG
jgi:tetratricopeptide (TPR) repeat protein